MVDKTTPRGAAEYFRDRFARCEALVADLDVSTLYNPKSNGNGTYRSAEDLGSEFIIAETGRGHCKHVELGLNSYPAVLDKARESETEGLRYFFEVVGQTRCADRQTFSAFADAIVKKRQIPGIDSFFAYVKRNHKKLFISTLGCDIIAQAAMKYFGFDSYVANPVAYYIDPVTGLEIISGCEILMHNGVEKAELTEEMLNKYGTSLGKSAVLVDSPDDNVLIAHSMFTIASTFADEPRIENVDLKIPGRNFVDFGRELLSPE